VKEAEIFYLSEYALEKVVKQIKTMQYAAIVPPEITTRQPGATLRQIINYHVYDDAWVPDVLAGKTAQQVGDKYDGDLLGEHPAVSFSQMIQRAITAVKKIHDYEKIVHLQYGDYPAHEYLRHITIFRGFRAYDIAKFIGVDATLPDDLVQGLWDLITPDAEELRALGVFAARVSVAPTADLQSRLLGLAGRDPKA
jgi:hypothetical protein